MPIGKKPFILNALTEEACDDLEYYFTKHLNTEIKELKKEIDNAKRRINDALVSKLKMNTLEDHVTGILNYLKSIKTYRDVLEKKLKNSKDCTPYISTHITTPQGEDWEDTKVFNKTLVEQMRKLKHLLDEI